MWQSRIPRRNFGAVSRSSNLKTCRAGVATAIAPDAGRERALHVDRDCGAIRVGLRQKDIISEYPPSQADADREAKLAKMGRCA